MAVHSKRTFFLRSLAVFLFLSLITYLSLSARPLGGYGPKFLDFEGADKLIHFFLYSAFCVLVIWAYLPYIHRHRTFIFIFFCIILYGIFMEICQGYIFPAGRTFSLLDIAANTIGVVISVIGFNLYHRII